MNTLHGLDWVRSRQIILIAKIQDPRSTLLKWTLPKQSTKVQMLASTGEATPKESSFFKRFIKNGSSIPSSISQTTENSLLLKPKKTINNLSSRLYQIVFDSINGIPVPNVVLQKASKLNANIGCKLSMSLFDLESAAFVGQTWISPYVIPVIKNIKKEEQNDSDSDVQTGDELTSPGLESLRAHLIGNKLNLKMKRQVDHHLHYSYHSAYISILCYRASIFWLRLKCRFQVPCRLMLLTIPSH